MSTSAAQALLMACFHMLSPLPVFVVPRDSEPRVSLVTDSVNRGRSSAGWPRL